jgi:AAA+ superfamily predicted ATPase
MKNNDWSTANQQYLAGMIKLIKEKLEWYNKYFDKTNERAKRLSNSTEEEYLKNLAETMPAPPAIDNLVAALHLTPFERDILVTCAGAELDTDLGALIASMQGDSLLSLPSFSLALAVFSEAHWSAVSPNRPLRFWRLIEMNKTQSITKSTIRIDEQVLHYLTGINYLNEKLVEITGPLYTTDHLVPSQQESADVILQICSQATNDSILPVIHLCGNERLDKMTMSCYITSCLGSELYTISSHSLPVNIRDVSEMARLWSRESLLKGYILLVDCTDIDTNDKSKIQSLITFIENINGLVIVSSEQWLCDTKRAKIVFDIEKPTLTEQLYLWKDIIESKHLNPGEFQLESLVSQFNLSAGTIRKAGFEVLSQPAIKIKNPEGDNGIQQKKLWAACCHHTRPQVDELAQRITPVATWDDIVLPEAQKSTLREIARQVKKRSKVYGEWGFASKSSRGLGISALFAGESGTGKTMASEVLANELHLDLYKIDLSKVVSKYIGETEKNLKRIFDAAENGGAILLFDEADALFGKRSDVKDSHDRYSNIEISYLLQRMEAYKGLAILTTNLKSSLDKAFVRRLRFIIQFPFPDAAQRAEIWSRVFPPNTPRDVLDPERLARLNIAGGSIRNIALNAAFFAADEDRPVCMSHISRAAKTEYDKMEKMLSPTEIKSW